MLNTIREWAKYFADNYYAWLIVLGGVAMAVCYRWSVKHGDTIFFFWFFLVVVLVIFVLGTIAFVKYYVREKLKELRQHIKDLEEEIKMLEQK